MTRFPRIATLAATVVAVAAAPSAAAAADKLVIRGAGFGHGVGMSQYGALGMAQDGWDHSRILAHYYTGTELGTVDPGKPVRVLLGGSAGVTRFSGATAAGGRALKASSTYGARRRADGRVDLLSPTGRRLRAVAAPLTITGPDAVRIQGRGAYRGAINLHPGGAGLDVVNVLGVDDYVRGVVAKESPSSWPAEALQAQAVAARTYALTTVKGVSPAWDHYADTRSQVYGGVGAETAATDAAVAETRGQVVTHQGRPVVTFFFSTSGGRTEDVENSLGGSAQPWLKAVDDPYDAVSPRHRWKPQTLTLTRAGAKLRGLVKGAFRGIEVVRRGRSPRIVAADVVGTRGRTRVTGAQLRARLGLYDTWAYFTALSAGRKPAPKGDDGQPPVQQLDPSGGANAQPARLGARKPISVLAGHVIPARSGSEVTVERRRHGRWVAYDLGRVGRDGGYSVGVRHRGTYRVKAAGLRSDALRVTG